MTFQCAASLFAHQSELQSLRVCFSAAPAPFLCCLRACEGGSCQREILWLCWQHRRLPKPPEKGGGGQQGGRNQSLLYSRESERWLFLLLAPKELIPDHLLLWIIIKRSHEVLTGFLRRCLRRLGDIKNSSSFFSYKATNYLSLRSELKASLHSIRSEIGLGNMDRKSCLSDF